MSGPPLPRLMLVTDRRRCRDRPISEVVVAAVAGGVGLVQLREKELPDDELLGLARELRGLLPDTTEIVVNGRADVARRCGCGLHLPEAMPLPRQAGPGEPRRPRLWGRSVHDPESAARTSAERPDYVVLGTIFRSASKPGRGAAGTALIRRARARIGLLPILAIGGITATRVPDVLRAGAWGVAVCGAILGADDPRRAAEELDRVLREAPAP